jgi:hypothetical protein
MFRNNKAAVMRGSFDPEGAFGLASGALLMGVDLLTRLARLLERLSRSGFDQGAGG